MASVPTFDVVFAGGGTVACVIAGRLARADPSLRILIIEAGHHTQNVEHHVQPGRYMHNLAQGNTFSHHHAVPSEALGGRSVCVPASRCVGGGSSVNAMMYTRAPASDYDDWEALGNPGWGSKDLIPLARKVETYQVPHGDPAVHGFTGPISVSHGRLVTNIGEEFLQTASQYDKSRRTSTSTNEDTNDFKTVDVYAPWPKYIDSRSGRRSDTAHHFIYNMDSSRHGLHIITNRRVVKVIFENDRAVGVQYAAREGSQPDGESQYLLETAYATHLVVLSSGAFGSPAILERSGIGSTHHLTDIGIQQLVDLPGVGENYNDHNIYMSPYMASEESDSMDGIFSNDEEAIKPYLTEWTNKGSGLLAHNAIDSAIRLRPTPKDLEELGPSFEKIWEEFYIKALDRPIGLLCGFSGNLSMAPNPRGTKVFTMLYCTMYPLAVGYTHVTSGTNPWAPVKFDPGYLKDPADIAVLRWLYKHSRELARRMKSYRGEVLAGHPIFPSATSAASTAVTAEASGPVEADAPEIVYSAEDDKAIEDHIRANVGTTWHSLGTCAMKPRDRGGVVDPRLNVYGVMNLKVADMSIVPLNVGANTYSTALIIGEKAFLIIAEDLGIPAVISGSSAKQ
ncbi:hypothetical protein GYMLUDRAFT_232266 [Collybiopsis luxurians FD-317 M1]|uniref:Glucose-methanol-choline oxidoreductase N-terminal domain-containing protein n=1 Tax=Collybiopsis luxurians FD-317 M1 TaxID=944289 RepID=A0A0D0CGQ1_9AGAR|nr:hypothetical protein GYMLUDRAFT_232266 [Collybiopsis luxurians FD-317 M1]